MEVKPGYKLTEIGVIPDDWRIKQLKDMFEIRAGGDYQPKHSSLYENDEFRYPIYANALTNKGLYGFADYFTDDYNSITVTARGKLGYSVYRDHPYVSIGRLLTLHPHNKEVNGVFYAEYLNQYVNFIQESTGVPQLTSPQIGLVVVPLPPKQEQDSISRMLTDTVSLITSLEKLIEKKKNIKQGVMQELLTGKRRLQGFSGEWESTTIDACFHILKGKGLSKTHLTSDGLHDCILYGELFTTYNDIIDEIHSSTDCYDGVESIAGDILLPGSTTTTGIDLAKASALLRDGVRLGGDINILRPKKELDSSFFAMYLNVVKRYAIAEKTKGITIHHLHGNDIKNILVELPSLSEQLAISTIIKTIDAELHSHENQLSKYSLIKQGMMQELLTGRIRLL